MENKPLFNIMSFYGYQQHIESHEKNGREYYRWVFNVCGFCFDDKLVHVLKSDGSEDEVPINKKGQILILGKWYGRDHWNH